MRRPQFILFAGICLFICLMLPVQSLCSPQKPVECLRQISLAIDNADGEEFQKLVDMDAIIADGLNIFLQEAQRPENAGKIPPMLAMIIAQTAGQGGGSSTIRSLIVGEAKKFVLSGINSGAFAGQNPDTNRFNGLIAPLFSGASMGRKEIRNIGVPFEDDQGWLVTFQVHDYGNDRDYPVIGRFVPSGDGCILAAIENMDRLLLQIMSEGQE